MNERPAWKANKVPNILMWIGIIFYVLACAIANTEERVGMKRLWQDSTEFVMPLFMIGIVWKHHYFFHQVKWNDKNYWKQVVLNYVLPLMLCFIPYAAFYQSLSLRDLFDMYQSSLVVKYVEVAIFLMIVYPFEKEYGISRINFVVMVWLTALLMNFITLIPAILRVAIEYYSYLTMVLYVRNHPVEVSWFVHKRKFSACFLIAVMFLISNQVIPYNFVGMKKFMMMCYTLCLLIFLVLSVLSRRNTIWKCRLFFRGYTLNKIYRIPTIIKMTFFFLAPLLGKIITIFWTFLEEKTSETVMDGILMVLLAILMIKAGIDEEDYVNDVKIYHQEE